MTAPGDCCPRCGGPLERDEVDAAWAATGVAGSVRGLTTLDDVIKVQRTDLINALERITELESELQDADQVMQDALGHARHGHRAALAAEREKVTRLENHIRALVDLRRGASNALVARVIDDAVAALETTQSAMTLQEAIDFGRAQEREKVRVLREAAEPFRHWHGEDDNADDDLRRLVAAIDATKDEVKP